MLLEGLLYSPFDWVEASAVHTDIVRPACFSYLSPSGRRLIMSSRYSATARLRQLSNQMASPFQADVVPKAPEDPLFGLMAAYRADTFEKKVDLGIGAYRDDNGKPWVLPVVKMVSNKCN
jgi:hypothetical protein